MIRTRTACLAAAWLTLAAVAQAQAPATAPSPRKEPIVKDIRFVVLHSPGPRWQKGKGMFEQEGLQDHVAHYRQLLEAGKLELGGPHVDEASGGMMIPAAGVAEDEIRAFALADPAVKSGLLKAEVRPWLIGMRK